MISSRSLSLCVLASVFTCSAAAVAQRVAPAARPTARIVSAIDESQLVSLSGNINPLANVQNDRGPVGASLPMAGLVMVLNRSLEQQEAFDAYVTGEYDPSSPNFHQWLTPLQIGAQYGPAPSDIAAITGWLTSRGFAVKSVSPDGMSIAFSGTAGQAQAAFHTQIHNLSVDGKMHIANMSDPQIPAALAPVVVGVKGLHNFLPHPLHRIGSKVQFSPGAHGWVKMQPSSLQPSSLQPSSLQPSPGAAFPSGPLSIRTPAASDKSASPSSPNYYFAYGGGPIEEDVAPFDFAKIYNLPSGWPTSTNGAGQIITVLGTSDITLGDVTNFRSSFGLPAGPALITAHGPDGDPSICTGNTNPCGQSDLEENSLDVEWSGGVAPGAQIVLVTDAYNSNTAPTNDPIYDDAQWAIANAFVSGSQVYGSRILSSSYGICELVNTSATNAAYNNLWQTAYAAGIAVFVASGDGGAATCDFSLGGDSIGNPYESQYGTTVNGNASTPWNTAVGGTDFSWCQPTISSSGEVQGCSSTNAANYWNASNSTQQSSAKTYVPETPWNDSCENPLNAAYLESVAAYFADNGINLGTFTTPEESCSWVYTNYATIYEDASVMLAPLVDTVGGGGGASSCVVNSSPSIYGATYAGPGACTASATSYGSLTLVKDGWPKPSWQTGVTGIPADGVRDLPDVSLFAGNGAFDSATLVCVTQDGATCTSIADTQCFNAGSCTGGAEEIGGTSVATPEMAGVMALINENAGAPQGNPNAVLYSLAAKQTYSECSAEGPPSASCYFNSVDQGTNTQPCAVSALDVEGGAIFENGAWEPGPTQAAIPSPNCSIVNNGDVIGTLAGYSAATGYNQANGLGSLNVSNVINAGVWTATAGTKAATIAINLGGATTISEIQSLNVTVTVSGASGTPTGTVGLTATNTSGYSSEQILSGGTATFTIPANTFNSIGTATLTATYSGSSTYATGSNTATIVVNLPPDFEVGNSGAISVPAGATTGNTTTFFVEPVGGFTGTVNLTCAISPVSGGVAPPTCTVGSPAVVTSGLNVNETVTVTSSTSTTLDGYTLTVTGTSGTDVHTSAIGMAIISAIGSTSTYTVSATTPGSISPGSSATSTITAQGSGGYTGSVTLSCSLNSGGPSNQSGDAPTCSITSGSPVNLTSGTPSGHATATINTTASVADLVRPNFGKGWPNSRFAEGAGATLAVLILFGIPARRRTWRAMLGMVALLVTLGSLAACGGGGGGTTTITNPGTTAGAYTFTVTSTGNPAVTPAPTTTFTVTVN